MDRHADILITGGLVLTMDDEDRTIPDGAVAVSGDIIAAVDDAAGFEGWRVDRTVDARGGIIMPGLVNVHTHAAMTCFRGLADDLPLMTWLNDHIFPAEATLDREKVATGTALACAEMILSGTTCFCDMYLFEDAVAETARRAGMRAVVGEVLFDFPSPAYGPLRKGFEKTQALIDQWRKDPLIRIAVEPHSPYLCAPDLLKKAGDTALKNDCLLVTHLSETRNEVDQIQKTYGRTPIAHMAELGLLGPHLLACHCVVLTASDRTLLARYDVKVAHNPESNMKLASGIAPIPQLLDAGVCVGLGTDGCSSNNDLDMLLEMDTAAKLHKVANLDPTVMDARTVLRMATIEGARALGLDGITGSLAPGKQADVIIVDTEKPHLQPMFQPTSHLVYAARGSDVAFVMIAGRVVMENGAVFTIDVDRAIREVNRIARGLR
ncbi:amidohydrolase [Desulfococcus multivorans]|jgi:5-methylthioadenosine/S-adenosylhomocysteine deaminase|uniref:5-methylthioadenosine/S-adenosylhomocysteine deaminase n=1 Tax=Desulfococcus multivorans DSM 2059 TaxID=1121405 RepID=S7TLU3_DESML|nr:amidohydrolase [Desulfococcus multivorans]AOY59635.1 MtaD: 5-methylthioadenosine/S-adenosylhomocysteine deaminase [Desulfococcus multivorans]AQV01824.1 S-adenosylhomocysteine deaminase [Desulfococcus multivorans]EPR37876.1 5-methylthioadenosine/S-adenosylhomocysteine deaminase [Desulfococcus multivorans DSM 2059]MDX9819057.1 amidohydrolase [Desulfococcus multivorans]SKA16269.1 5-methylthioadenosine/S-adenosylhomocysteine deaminase [Desulfococcus multivorans DSM 2059]